jgi:hypothetical protein
MNEKQLARDTETLSSALILIRNIDLRHYYGDPVVRDLIKTARDSATRAHAAVRDIKINGMAHT